MPCRRKHPRKLYSVSLLAGLLAVSGPGFAALTLTLLGSPDFGILFSGSSGRQFLLNTDGSISGANASDYISGAAAGQFTLADNSYPSSVTILVDNISASGGLTVNKAVCSYNGGAQTRCDGSGMNVTSISSASLKLGLDISTSTSHGGGSTASVSADVSVAYL